MIQTIAHPTDFSAPSERAFAHALVLALTTRSRLCLMHVREKGAAETWDSFPRVRAALARWGLLDAAAPHSEIEAKLGIKVEKVEIAHSDPIVGLSEFLLSHRPDLMVMATHGREGPSRWLVGSVSEEIARRTHVPSLFIGPEALGFVDEVSGEMRLHRVLLPVAHEPSPRHALLSLDGFLTAIGAPSSAVRLLHVGDAPPDVLPATANAPPPPVELERGPVVETILRVAETSLADLIAMPTAGRHGILDALKGSTTEQVLRHAPCPLLALPAAPRAGP